MDPVEAAGRDVRAAVVVVVLRCRTVPPPPPEGRGAPAAPRGDLPPAPTVVELAGAGWNVNTIINQLFFFHLLIVMI